MRGLLSASNAIDCVLGAIARWFGWGFVALVIVICFDVISRKAGFQLYILGLDLGSTRLQEPEKLVTCYRRLPLVLRILHIQSGLNKQLNNWPQAGFIRRKLTCYA